MKKTLKVLDLLLNLLQSVLMLLHFKALFPHLVAVKLHRAPADGNTPLQPDDLRDINKTRDFFPPFIFMTHQRLVFNLLPDEFILAEGISRLSSDGVYGPLFHLLFDGTEQHEERLAGTLLCFGGETGD